MQSIYYEHQSIIIIQHCHSLLSIFYYSKYSTKLRRLFIYLFKFYTILALYSYWISKIVYKLFSLEKSTFLYMSTIYYICTLLIFQSESFGKTLPLQLMGTSEDMTKLKEYNQFRCVRCSHCLYLAFTCWGYLCCSW